MQVSRPVLIAAATAFFALAATVFFLLGRESVRRRPALVMAAAPPPASEPAPAPAPAPTPAPLPSVVPSLAAAPRPPPMPSTVPTPAPAAPSAPAPPGAPMTLGITEHAAPPAAPSNDDATAVRDYFLRVQGIQATAPSTDPNELANKLLASSLGGDTSGLDELVRVTEEGANRARAISPPPACVDYHEHLIGMLGESASMVKQLKAALTSKDASALAAMSATGSSLQSRANALEDQARQIKSQYGVR